MNRFGKLTKENTPILLSVLLGLRVIGMLLAYLYPQALYYLVFDVEAVLQGEVWRLVTFVMYPSGSGISGIFFLAIMTFVYFSIGRTLVQVIGKFRLNFFLISGLILTVIFGVIYYIVMKMIPGLNDLSFWVQLLNPDFLYPMLFVLFSLLFPDSMFLIMFIIPIRGKWMVFITLGFYLLEVLQAFFQVGFGYAWILIAMIMASVLTMIIYYFLFRNGNDPFNASKNKKTQTVYTDRAKKSENRTASYTRLRLNGNEARHKCTICGRTEKTNPELEFRYCTKCIGNYEYCSDHLYTHLHKYPNVTDGNGGQK